jgi:hypothetical protein
MRFSVWAKLADEYAVKYWQWTDPLYDVGQAYKAYQDGATPKEHIDKIAVHIGLVSYPDTHQGKLPNDFSMFRYTTNYGD